ncbi:unnamed protein product [Leptidea sinapis]|uniref:Chitin-binding type-2 domain-containing protein n=1 Tax=Leptidea sinapis TaxID=189913 RepID=A0A5E4QV80_9NEOP|nr:unnamed protein product [Leptidea sinapis]
MNLYKAIFKVIVIASHIIVSDGTEHAGLRDGRVNGHVVKLYSGLQPDPIKCLGEGFQGDQNDCSIFYRCTKSNKGHYTVYKFQCGPGTIYDADKEVCNHPGSTKRTECGTTFDRHVTVNDINENQYELPTPLTTKDPFNWGSKVNVDPSAYMPPYSDHNQSLEGYQSSGPIITTTQSIVEKPDAQLNNIIASTATETCTSSGFMGDSKDCKRFYRCVENLRGGFIRYEFSCSDATIWDDSLQGCNHPWLARNSRCRKDDFIQESINHSPTTIKTQVSNELDFDENLESGYGSKLFKPQSQNLMKEEHYQTPVHQSYYEKFTKPNFESSTNPSLSEFHYGINNSTHIVNFSVTSPSNPYIYDKFNNSTTNNKKFIENKSNDCSQSGFFENKQDCKKFYRCVENGRGSFNKYEFTCSDGTVWDQKNNACNYAWSVKGCESDRKDILTITTTSVTKPPINASSQTLNSYNVYNEDNEVKRNITVTPKHNITSSGYSNAPFSSVHFMQSSTITNHILNNDSTYGFHENNPLISTTNNASHSIDKPIKNLQNRCRISGFIGDSRDCKKFYRCVDSGNGKFIQYEFSCGEGTVWDSRIESCNHAWAVNECREKSDEVKRETTTATTYISSARPVTNQIENKCKMEGFMNHEEDCRKFYRCVSNNSNGYIRYEYTCEEGTAWDLRILACSSLMTVRNCKSFNKNEIHMLTTPYFESNKLHPIETVSRQTISINPTTTEVYVSKKTSKCEISGFIGDVYDCKKFYRCVDNGKGDFIQYEFICGENTVWDQDIQACNYNFDNSCRTDTNKLQITTTQSLIASNPSTISALTTTAQEIQHSTIQPFSDESEPYPINTFNQDKCSSEGFFANNEDCKKFYRCVRGNAEKYDIYEFSCGEGTIWVQEILACDYDTGISCNRTTSNSSTQPAAQATLTVESTTIRVSPSPSSSKNPLVDSETINYSETTPLYSNTKQSSTVKPQQSEECKSEGFYENKDDCTRFYRCVSDGRGGLQRYDFVCAEGTAWDTKINTCNHIYNVPSCQHFDNSSPNQESLPNKPIIHDGTEMENQSTTVSTTSAGTTTHSPTKSPKTTIAASSTEISQTTSTTSSNSANTPKTTILDGDTTMTTKTSSMSTIKENDCKDVGFYGNTSDCKKFYRCVEDGKGGFIKYDFDCGEGTIWDQDITTCNHPNDVIRPSCSTNQNNSSTATTSSKGPLTSTNSNDVTTTPMYSSSSTSNQQSTSTEHSSTESTTTMSTNSSSNDQQHQAGNNNFTCSKAGFYANQYDCKKFYRCVDWNNDGKTFSIFYFECGEGTIWDPSLETCNYEESVYPPRNCSYTLQNTTTSTTTTTKKPTQQTTSPNSQTTKEEQSTTVKTTTTTKSTKATDQTTVMEKTTTGQTTIAEKTTTEQTTVAEKTTTDQTTVTEKPTTDQTTVTDKTTTDQTTVSDKTTTDQTTITDKTTTDQTTATETTTTSTTSEGTQQTTTEQQPTTTETTTESSDNSTTEKTPAKDCPNTDKNQYLYVCPTSFRRHPRYCNMFYQCLEDEENHDLKIATFYCPNNTIYDENKVQCVNESKAEKKCNGAMTQTHRIKRLSSNSVEPFTVDTGSYACSNVGYYQFERNEECSSAFLKCSRSIYGNITGHVLRCPKDFVFWTISKRCERIINVKGCKRSNYSWNSRFELPIEVKNVAP